MKTKFFVLLSIQVGLFIGLKAQQPSVVAQKDSLMAVLIDLPQDDAIGLTVIQKVALSHFRFINPDSSFYSAQLEYDFAKKMDYKMTSDLNVQGDACLHKNLPNKALESLSHGLVIAQEMADHELGVKTLLNIAGVLQSREEIEKTLECSLQTLELSEVIGDQKGIASSVGYIGEIYAGKGDVVLGFGNLNRAQTIFEVSKDFNSLPRRRYTVAALELLPHNLEYYKTMGDKTLLAVSLSNVAGIYQGIGNNKKASEYLERVLAVEAFNSNSYDDILNGVQMPVMNGLDATMEIRSIERSSVMGTCIPIIAMTARLLKTEMDKCCDTGMNNCIPKPYALNELNTPIHNALQS
ncbi:MAG: CheY-like chemotaxis protein [Cryomorphaceae bacterium]|jgi:CheY-like chemotaxis protein